MFFAPVRVNRAALNGYGYVPSAWAQADVIDRVLTDRIFADAFDSTTGHTHVESDDATITLSMDVPGLSKEQLTIGVEGRVVRIASKDDAPRSVKATYKLGSDVDLSKSQAKLEHGVLTLKFAKIPPESRQTLLAIE